ncbi:MAG TPA: LamG-like jellyroll fold domain-containing protein, partial [Gemmataceae bacterium]|nr:LamG-like jellyroll fold domain-containing protein [Gemmataceae bacterium]
YSTLVSQRVFTNPAPVLDLRVSRKAAAAFVRPDGNADVDPVILRGGDAINDGLWHHVALTRSPDGELELFVDGERKAQGGALVRGAITSRTCTLGAERYDILRPFVYENSHFEGCIDEFCIFGHVLSPKEIAALAGR